MNDPEYRYQRGVGWLPYGQARILTSEDVCGIWYHDLGYHYPEICRGRLFIEKCLDLEIGDFVPFGQHWGKVVTGPQVDNYYPVIVLHDDGADPQPDILLKRVYSGVRR